MNDNKRKETLNVKDLMRLFGKPPQRLNFLGNAD